MQAILDRIKKKDMHIGIVGLGYVELPLAVESAKSGSDGENPREYLS